MKLAIPSHCYGLIVIAVAIAGAFTVAFVTRAADSVENCASREACLSTTVQK